MAEVPYSFAVRARDIPASGMNLHIVADPSEREQIARTLGIPAVTRIEADIRLEPMDGQAVRLHGTLKGDVVQTCIVTLDPVEQAIEESLDVTFLPEGERNGADGRTVLLNPLSEEDFEYYSDGRIVLAEFLTELLALGLDPYPRLPGTDFPAHIEDDTSDRVSPFESLKQLKDNKS